MLKGFKMLQCSCLELVTFDKNL